MKLSEKAAREINKTRIRLKLAMKLECTERWISILIAKNESDGDLTKTGIVQLISEETGLKVSQILEKETAKV